MLKLWPWSELAELRSRITDIERHFVTKRDAAGAPVETLADVPYEQRKKKPVSLRGTTWAQKRQWLEQTDGGRNM